MAEAGGFEAETGRRPGRSRVVVADPHPLVVEALGVHIAAEADLELLAAIGEIDVLAEEVARLAPDAAVVAFDLWPTPAQRIPPEIVGAVASRTALTLIYDRIDAREVWQGLRAGARGIVSRGAPAGEFINAIRETIAGGDHLDAAAQRDLASLIRGDDGAGAIALTAREREVIRLSADGLSTGEIAKRMGLSASSIKASLQRTYAKLGVHDRPAAVAQALRRGLIT